MELVLNAFTRLSNTDKRFGWYNVISVIEVDFFVRKVNCLVRDKNRLVVPPGSGGSKAGSPLTGAFVVQVLLFSAYDCMF